MDAIRAKVVAIRGDADAGPDDGEGGLDGGDAVRARVDADADAGPDILSPDLPMVRTVDSM